VCTQAFFPPDRGEKTNCVPIFSPPSVSPVYSRVAYLKFSSFLPFVNDRSTQLSCAKLTCLAPRRLCRFRFYARTHVRIKDERNRMDEAITTPPTFKRSFFERIYCVEFSPYEWSQHLICIALAKEIVVGTVRFQVRARELALLDENCYRFF